MDDASSIGSVLLQSKDMRHDIVAPYAFLFCNDLECFIAHDQIRTESLEGLVGNLGEAQFLFGFCEPEPELSPCGSSFSGREYPLYLAA